MRRFNFLFLILVSLKLGSISPSYSMESPEEKDRRYSNVFKRGIPLQGYNLYQSYFHSFDHFHRRWQEARRAGDGQDQCRFALALSEILLEPLASADYGIEGKKLKGVIAGLEISLKSMNFDGLSGDDEKKWQALQRLAIIYQTMLALRWEELFPGHVGQEDFTGFYEKLSTIHSPNTTATIPLYMAHLIVMNDVRPDGISKEDALKRAEELIDSTYGKRKPKDQTHSLFKVLKPAQNNPPKAPVSLCTKPSLTTQQEQAHRRTIEAKIAELNENKTKPNKDDKTSDANGTQVSLNSDEQLMQLDDNIPLGPLRKKSKRLIESESDEDTEPLSVNNNIIEIIEQPKAIELPKETQQQPRKRRRLIESEEDHEQSDADESENDDDAERARPKKKRKIEADNTHNREDYNPYNRTEVEKYILEQWEKGITPKVTDIISALNYEKSSQANVAYRLKVLKERNPARVPEVEGYNHEKVEEYVLSQWEKGHQPKRAEIMQALGYEGEAIGHKVSSYVYSLKKIRFPDRAPQKEVTPTQKIIKFFEESDPWQNMDVLYQQFNKSHPKLIAENYFTTHAALVRKYLALKKKIDPSTKAHGMAKFKNVVAYVETNPKSNFQKFLKTYPKASENYFDSIKTIYKDYNDYCKNNNRK